MLICIKCKDVIDFGSNENEACINSFCVLQRVHTFLPPILTSNGGVMLSMKGGYSGLGMTCALQAGYHFLLGSHDPFDVVSSAL